MAYTTIDKGSSYFNTILYTGNGSTQSITGVGFQPDWVWLKDRDNTTNHMVFDVTRGTGKELHTQNADTETTQADTLTAFGADGFSLGSNNDVNKNSTDFVSWNWRASGSTASNSDGSITTTISANTTSGFSIMKYAGSGSAATIGHGLGAAPSVIIFKETDGGESWRFHHTSLPNNDSNTLALNNNSGSFSQTNWISAISNSTISIGTDSSFNTSGNNYIAYAFAEKKGYSKFGQYLGNGNQDGAYVHCGFRPAWILIKNISSGSHNWLTFDSKRDIDNPVSELLMPNEGSAESTMGTSNPLFDFTANGFKLRGTGSDGNESGSTHVFMAFAENPFVSSSGTPVTAR